MEMFQCVLVNLYCILIQLIAYLIMIIMSALFNGQLWEVFLNGMHNKRLGRTVGPVPNKFKSTVYPGNEESGLGLETAGNMP